MAIKTFTAGSVLTAADTNTYLANSGLVYVKSQTVGSGVTSVTVTDAFSSTYDNYLIQLSGGTGSTNTVANFRLGSTTSGYRFNYIYTSWNSTPEAVGTTTGTSVNYAGSFTTTGSNMNLQVQSPFLSCPTRMYGDGSSMGNFSGTVTAFEPTSTSFTAFTILVDSGTRTGGTITVYGYRKA